MRDLLKMGTIYTVLADHIIRHTDFCTPLTLKAERATPRRRRGKNRDKIKAARKAAQRTRRKK